MSGSGGEGKVFVSGGEGMVSDGGSNLSLREEAAIFSDSGSILLIGSCVSYFMTIFCAEIFWLSVLNSFLKTFATCSLDFGVFSFSGSILLDSNTSFSSSSLSSLSPNKSIFDRSNS